MSVEIMNQITDGINFTFLQRPSFIQNCYHCQTKLYFFHLSFVNNSPSRILLQK